MATPRILKNMNCIVNGRGMAGVAKTLKLPEIALKTEGYRGGGMDAETEVDMGMDAMKATYTFADPDPENFKLVGVTSGNSARVTARGSFVRDSDGARVAVTVEMGGRFNKLSMGDWEAGKSSDQEFEHCLNYYRLNVGGEDVIEIDVLNMKRIIGGVDQLAGIRADIGL
jgi:hypothetical protein